jgi:hypothetical protein
VCAAGCSRPESKKPVRVEIHFADAAVPAAQDDTPAEHVALAKAALDALRALASHCELYDYAGTEFRRVVDNCGIWETKDVEALSRARKALDASQRAPQTGFAPVFTRRIREFDDMASKLYKNEQGYWAERNRGVLLRYQELALLWNTWRPASEAVPVDVGRQRAVKVAPGPRGYIEWAECSNGPCIVLPKSP